MTRRVKLEIRDYNSPDVDLRSWRLDSTDRKRFLIELEIGEAGDDRADLFQVVVATPEGLRESKSDGVIAERATLVLTDCAWPRVREAIGRIVERCEGQSWTESVWKLQRYFRWEYEDYRME